MFNATRVVAVIAVALVGTGLTFATLFPPRPSGPAAFDADGTIVVAQDASGEVRTIGEAVTLAKDGDTIVVKPGVYPESITIDKDVTLMGDGDSSAIVIEPTADAPQVPLDGRGGGDGRYGLYLVDSAATVRGLTVRGLETGLAVVVDGGAPALEGIIIDLRGTWADGSLGRPRRSLTLDQGTRGVVRDVTILGQGEVIVTRGATPTIERSRLTDTCLVIEGVGTDPLVDDSTIQGCPSGESVQVSGGASGRIERNDVSAGGFDIFDQDHTRSSAATASTIRSAASTSAAAPPPPSRTTTYMPMATASGSPAALR